MQFNKPAVHHLRSPSILTIAIATAISIAHLTTPAHATVIFWDFTTTNGNYASVASWVGGVVPGPFDDAEFHEPVAEEVRWSDASTNTASNSIVISKSALSFRNISATDYEHTTIAGVTVTNDGSLRLGTPSSVGEIDLDVGGFLTVFYGADLLTDPTAGSDIIATELRIGTNGGASSTVTIQGTGSTLTVPGETILGRVASTGNLIFAGGSSGNSLGIVRLGDVIGNSSGNLTVDGSDLSTGTIFAGTSTEVGQSASILITAGGELSLKTGASFTLGASSTSTATATINSSSTFNTTSTGSTTVNPTGTLHINGGTFNANHDVTIDGGTINKTSGSFNLDSGATLTVQNGGTFDHAGNFDIGDETLVFTDGTIDTDGLDVAAGTFSHTGGTLNINSGALQTPNATYSINGASNPTINLSGASTSWNIPAGNQLWVASSNDGTLNINSGADLNSSNTLFIAPFAGGNGSLTVGGTGSTLSVNQLDLGFSGGGSATLTINTGATVTSAIRTKVWDNNTLNLHGGTFNTDGLELNTTGATFNHSDGTLNVNDGNLLILPNTDYSINGTGFPTQNLNNADLTITNAKLRVGTANRGTLNINAGSTVTTNGQGTSIATIPGSSGTLKVAGAGATLNTFGITVGGEDQFTPGGGATLTIENGGTVNADPAVVVLTGDKINLHAGGSLNTQQLVVPASTAFSHTGGTLNIDGHSLTIPGSTITHAGPDNPTINLTDANWNPASVLDIGSFQSATLNVNANAEVNVGFAASAATFGGSTATVNIAGANAKINAPAFYVGGAAFASGGTANVTIESGGSLNTTNTTKVWNNATINLNDGGTINTTNFDLSAPGATFNHNGGTLNIDNGTLTTPDISYFLDGPDSPTINIDGASASWDLGAGNQLVVGGASPAALTINDSASVNAPAATFIGSTSGPAPSITVNNNANLTTTVLHIGDIGPGIFILDNSGSTNVTAASTKVFAMGILNLRESTTLDTKGLDLTTPGATFIHSGGTLILNNAQLQTPDANYTINGTHNPTVTFDGPSATWNRTTRQLTIADDMSGTLNVINSAILNTGPADIAFSAGGNGNATVSGNGSQWNLASDLRLGVGNGGFFASGSSGTLSVLDQAQLSVTGDLTLGLSEDATGTLNIQSAAQATVTGKTHVKFHADASGSINIAGTDSRLQTASFQAGTMAPGGLILSNDVNISDAGLLDVTTGPTQIGGNARANVTTNGTLNAQGTLDVLGILSIDTGGTATAAALDASDGFIAIDDPPTGFALTITDGLGKQSNQTIADTIGGSGSILKTGPGKQTLAGNNTFSGGITINGGTIALAHDNAAGTGPITILGSDIEYADTINTPNPIDLHHDANLSVPTGAATQSGPISETAGPWGITKTGPGTLTLAAANTHTGHTTIQEGTLEATTNNNLGDNTAPITFTGGSLRMTNPALASFPSSRTIVTNGADAVIDFAGSNFRINGPITGDGGLTKNGTAVLTLSTTPSTYAGPTILNTGLFQTTTSDILPDTTDITMGQGWRQTAAAETIGTLNGPGNIQFNHPTASHLTIGANNNDGNLLGKIVELRGIGSLTKIGTGTQTLAGASTYKGTTTIQAGTLIAANTTGSATGSGPVIVQAGASLAGTGTVTGPVTIEDAATLAPGTSPGIFNINTTLTLAPSATLAIEALNPTTPTPAAGIDHDQLNITGNVTLNGDLNITSLPDNGPIQDTLLGTTYNILNYTTRTTDSFFQTITGTLIETDFALAPLLDDPAGTLNLRATIPGDLNLDNKVSVADLSTFALNFGTTPGLYNETNDINSWQLGDFNTDGQITVADLSLLALNFGFDAGDPSSAPLGLSLTDAAALVGIDPATIPEPTTIAPLLIWAITRTRPRKHRHQQQIVQKYPTQHRHI